MNFIPTPLEVMPDQGALDLASLNGIACDTSCNRTLTAARVLATVLSPIVHLPIRPLHDATPGSIIRLEPDTQAEPDSESYLLRVDAGDVTIRGASAGLS